MPKSILFACFTVLLFLPLESAQSQTLPRGDSPASLGIVGDSADVTTPTQGGVVLMGGGTNVNSALRWMIKRSGGGDAVVISASLTEPNQSLFKLGGANSVETLNIDSRAKADDERTAQTIRNAEMVFIGGGKQSDYLRFWKDTKVMDALNFLLIEKKAPVGGSSAGCAILGGLYFSALHGSAVSDVSLKNPFDTDIDLGRNDFLHAPLLANVMTDTHYLTRGRQGRHLTFLARASHDWKIMPNGIGVDEGTAVCVDEKGMGRVLGASKAYFLWPSADKAPEICQPKTPLQWDRNHQAVRVYELGQAPDSGFDITTGNPEKATGGKWFWWWADKGELHQDAF